VVDFIAIGLLVFEQLLLGQILTQRVFVADDKNVGMPGLHHQHDLARRLERSNQLLHGSGVAREKRIYLVLRAVESGNCVALAFHIQNQVFTHYRQAYQANIRK